MSQLAFELLSQLRLSQHTFGKPYQSRNYLCSLIHIWSLRYHQFLLFLHCLCGWDCVFLEVLLGIQVFIFSTRSLCIVVLHLLEFIVFTSLPTIMLFGVNTFNWMPPSTYVKGRLFKPISTSSNIFFQVRSRSIEIFQ